MVKGDHVRLVESTVAKQARRGDLLMESLQVDVPNRKEKQILLDQCRPNLSAPVNDALRRCFNPVQRPTT